MYPIILSVQKTLRHRKPLKTRDAYSLQAKFQQKDKIKKELDIILDTHLDLETLTNTLNTELATHYSNKKATFFTLKTKRPLTITAHQQLHQLLNNKLSQYPFKKGTLNTKLLNATLTFFNNKTGNKPKISLAEENQLSVGNLGSIPVDEFRCRLVNKIRQIIQENRPLNTQPTSQPCVNSK